MEQVSTFINGLAVGFSLIMAIGSQNIFVFNQGLRGSHIFITCLFCAVSDAILIVVGTIGVSLIVNDSPDLTRALYLIAGCWLGIYGINRLQSAYHKTNMGLALEQSAQNKINESSWKTLGTVAILTWANPHVYLDTVLLIGTFANATEKSERVFFVFGAIVSSFVFFFFLGYLGKMLGKHVKSGLTWIVIDFSIAILMFFISGTMFYKFLS